MKKVYARTVKKRQDSDSELPRPTTLTPRIREPRDFKMTKSDQIAGSYFHIRNWKWPGATEDFPQEPWLRTVDKFYPNAEGGALAIDEPTLQSDIVACERKEKMLRARGVRYLILKETMDATEAKMELARAVS